VCQRIAEELTKCLHEAPELFAQFQEAKCRSGLTFIDVINRIMNVHGLGEITYYSCACEGEYRFIDKADREAVLAGRECNCH
jgi:hypothetical protein